MIETLSEDLLRVFAEAKLIDKYDVYQHLMSYWTDTMQDDVYMIALDGWKANSDLIPPQLIINRYFAADQQNIEQLEAAREAITHKMEELDEEHGGEGGLLEEAKNEKGKITRASVHTRLKDILTDWDDPSMPTGESAVGAGVVPGGVGTLGSPSVPLRNGELSDATDERTMLHTYLNLLEQETEASKKVKAAQKALDAKVASRYKTLSENEVKTLVVEDKWLATLASDVEAELNHISQALTGRIKELGERYTMPLPRLSEEVEVLSSKVEAHLKEMGFVWS